MLKTIGFRNAPKVGKKRANYVKRIPIPFLLGYGDKPPTDSKKSKRNVRQRLSEKPDIKTLLV